MGTHMQPLLRGVLASDHDDKADVQAGRFEPRAFAALFAMLVRRGEPTASWALRQMAHDPSPSVRRIAREMEEERRQC